MALGPSQRRIVVGASFMVLLLGLFPPWTDGTRIAHGFILAAYRTSDRIDGGLLLAEAMIVVGVAVIWCLLFCRSLAELQSDPVTKYLPER